MHVREWATHYLQTWQVVGTFELVGDVSALKDLQDQLVPFCFDFLLESHLDLPHYLCFTA